MTTPLEPMCDAELQLLAVLAASCPDTPDEVLRLLAEVERLRSMEGDAKIAKAFHDEAIAERDLAIYKRQQAEAEVERLRGIVQFHEALADVADDLRADLHECYKGLKNCDAEASRLRALLRRWLREAPTEGMRLYSDGCSYHCALCGASNKDSLRIPHLDGCIVGDTLKALEATNDDATE